MQCADIALLCPALFLAGALKVRVVVAGDSLWQSLNLIFQQWSSSIPVMQVILYCTGSKQLQYTGQSLSLPPPCQSILYTCMMGVL